MGNILNWGIAVVLWFQRFSPLLDLPFKIFTFLGEEEFFLLFLPFIYWCIDHRHGAKLIILFLLSTYVNVVAKMMLGQPRPFEYDIRVRQFCKSSGGGLPSGHTQNSVIIWGYLGVTFKRTWLWIVAGLLLLFIPLSRVYLGVHFPTDLLGGYSIGLALLVLYLRLEPIVSQWIKIKNWGWQISIAIVVPLILALCFFTKEGVTVSSTLMGMGVGFIVERHWVCFESKGVWWKRALRFLLGVAILFSIWLGLRILFSGAEPALLFRSIRYSIVGLWGSLGAPWIFIKLRLAETEGERTQEQQF